MSWVSIVSTVVVSILTALALALALDPTRPKRRGANGQMLNLPPTVPWTFILPRMGNVRALMVEIGKRYGNLVSIHFPFRGSILFPLGNNASVWFHRSLKDMHAVTEGWVPKFPEELGGQEWIKLTTRSLSQEFYRSIQTSLQGLLRERITKWAAKCAEGENFDVFKEGHDVVLDVNTMVMFGDDWDEADLATYKEAFVMTDPATWISNPVHLIFPFLSRSTRDKWGKVLIETSMRHASKHIQHGLNPNASPLDFYLSEVPESLSIATHLAWSLEMASFVTTGSAASWLFYHLADDPALQDRVRAELMSAVPKGEDLSLEHLSKMHFIDSLIREVIRTHLFGLGMRVAPEDLKYEDMDIPKDSTIMYAHFSTHHNEENFADPFVFKPDRFLDESGEYQGLELTRSCTLLAFGAGRHPCIGMRLAVNELKTLCWELLIKYDIKLLNKAVLPPPGLGFDTPSNSVRFVVSRRE